MNLRIIAILLPAVFLCAFEGSPATINVSGGIPINGVTQPLLFTWNSALTITGTGWTPGESVTIVLRGPVNSPGIAATDFTLGAFAADGQGNFFASPAIPYDGGAIGAAVRIPRPGLYQVHVTGAASGDVVAADDINLCPATYSGDNAQFNWGHERGGRDGVLPGDLRQFSPERFDPEWPAVWDERPVEVYGVIQAAGDDG